jgi:hypothetical protein
MTDERTKDMTEETTETKTSKDMIEEGQEIKNEMTKVIENQHQDHQDIGKNLKKDMTSLDPKIEMARTKTHHHHHHPIQRTTKEEMHINHHQEIDSHRKIEERTTNPITKDTTTMIKEIDHIQETEITGEMTDHTQEIEETEEITQDTEEIILEIEEMIEVIQEIETVDIKAIDMTTETEVNPEIEEEITQEIDGHIVEKIQGKDTMARTETEVQKNQENTHVMNAKDTLEWVACA